jgi:hypothetical protein
MEQILKALKTLPKEFLAAIILELMKDQTISYEDITQVYVEYLNMLRKGTSEKFLTLQSKIVSMYTGNAKDRKDALKDVMHWLLDNGSINTTHEEIDKHK